MRFGKNILSQNLRTHCDLALYHTLSTPADRRARNLPEPIKSRPSVESLQEAGIQFERGIYRMLAKSLGPHCIAAPRAANSDEWPDLPIETALRRLETTPLPAILLQPKMELGPLARATYRRLGVPGDRIGIMPTLDGLIPDVLMAVPVGASEYEILPSAERKPIATEDDRVGLAVIDVKHARDPNPSYSAEVVLYAVMLANWLEHHGLQHRFAVLDRTYLWTRGSMARGNFEVAVEQDAPKVGDIIEAIGEDLEEINTPIYLQTIRRFLTEHVPDVIKRGNADWTALDWAVGSACGSCDWLAYPSYLSPAQRETVRDNPNGYCSRRARTTDHLSRMPVFTKGARRVMRAAGLDTVAKIARTTGGEGVYGQHNRLQAERVAVPAYAQAIVDNVTAIDPDRKDGLLARYADLDVFVSVNFDVGSGLVTGIGAQVRFSQPTPFDANRPDDWERPTQGRMFTTKQWVTTGKSSAAEEAMLFGFLQFVAGAIEHAHDPATSRGGPHAGSTGTQVVFWSDREFEELCLAMGRHLSTVLFDKQATRILRSMAWLFPAEELQERDDLEPSSPTIAFVQRTLNRLVRTPSEHALTLFRVAEHYRHVSEKAPDWRPPDTFYAEPFSDGVPRERIYEIWRLMSSGGAGVAKWGSVRKPLSELISGYENALRKQVNTLADVTVRLRKDFGKRLRAKSGRLSTSIPGWLQGGAPDTKLLAAWASFEHAFATTQAFRRFFMDPEEIEASHTGIRLVRYLRSLPDGIHEYEISDASANTKLKAPDRYLRLMFNDVAGFLSLRVGEVIGRAAPPDRSNWSMHHVFGAELVELDRGGRTARIRMSDDPDDRALRSKIMTALGLSRTSDMTLVAGLGSSTKVDRLKTILKEIGNPAMAAAAPETATALGKDRPFPRGSGPVKPPARVLWDAGTLAGTVLRDDAAVDDIASVARHLNPSQRAAVRHAARMALTPLWGPPGTGKTETATAFVHGTIRHEVANPSPQAYAILLTGPNYKAVSELVGRVLKSLDGDRSAPCAVYLVREEDRAPDLCLPTQLNPHVRGMEIVADDREPGIGHLSDDLGRPGVVLVATVVHQCPKIAQALSRVRSEAVALVRPCFDLVLIDESSQVDMSVGAGPIALLKETFQLVVAGDVLQMPPVFQSDAPVGAEYLVGSVQTYITKRFKLPTVDLLQNYRSHGDIVAYIKRLGYPPSLTASNPDTALRWLRPVSEAVAEAIENGGVASDAWTTLLDPARAIVALTYPDGMSGQANPFEAACIATMVHALFIGTSSGLDGRTPQDDHAPWTDEAFWERGVGVVTPHRAQRAQVLSALERTFPKVDPALIEGAVDTVERFQGGQRHTILISFGLGDPDLIGGEERFLLKLERTNVALSRAMAKCIVVMSEEMAGHLPADRQAAEGAHALRGIVDEWCNRSRSTSANLQDGTIRPIRPRWRG